MVALKFLVFAFAIFAELQLTRTSRHSTTTTTTTTTTDATTSNDDSKTTSTTTTTVVHCQPLPDDVLWRRIDPRSRSLEVEDDPNPTPHTRPRRGAKDQPPLAHAPHRNRKQEPKESSSSHFRKRKREPIVTLLEPQPHSPHHLPPTDVYREVTEYQDGVASSRRKRKSSQSGNRKSSGMKQQYPHGGGGGGGGGAPWQCRLEKRWKRMRDGVFPPRIQTGSCVVKTCMMAMYQCRARKYAVRVMKRVDGRCNPLPLIGSNSTFEEIWVMDHYKVTVGCECARMKPTGSYPGAGKT